MSWTRYSIWCFSFLRLPSTRGKRLKAGTRSGAGEGVIVVVIVVVVVEVEKRAGVVVVIVVVVIGRVVVVAKEAGVVQLIVVKVEVVVMAGVVDSVARVTVVVVNATGWFDWVKIDRSELLSLEVKGVVRERTDLTFITFFPLFSTRVKALAELRVALVALVCTKLVFKVDESSLSNLILRDLAGGGDKRGVTGKGEDEEEQPTGAGPKVKREGRKMEGAEGDLGGDAAGDLGGGADKRKLAWKAEN